MSLNKWKLTLASLSVALFTACAGSSNSGSSDAGYNASASDNSTSASYSSNDDDSSAPAPVVKKEEPKEVFDEAAMKKAQNEAIAVNEENHKVRKEIFDAKNKLGMPIEAPAE